ncbi:AAA family ATPase [Rhizobium leguminosarum]|uniref:AAA family ATPase n=1 Tax=Rhizobium leguminosarum TaxID=384 RepID=UPI001C91B228|nr:AAA family ATPase [Rhizobium leguminosarum]MBY2968009.1 AAA family ATPase [Rhizobium leguminosarum]
MSAMRKTRLTSLPAPYLKRLWVREDAVLSEEYPFNLPWLDKDFALDFATPVTIIVGENGTGKSTLVEAVAALCGYDEAGGGKGYNPVDHSRAIDRSGALLASALRAAWLPKVTAGWFFRAESFFSVARFLDEAARDANAAPPDFLSWSHGEGFVRFFEERMSKQGVYLLDEPESALSPKRQLELLRVLHTIQGSASAQIIMATHSPILMAVSGARLLEITPAGLAETELRDTRHFKLYRDFTEDPDDFVARALRDEI